MSGKAYEWRRIAATRPQVVYFTVAQMFVMKTGVCQPVCQNILATVIIRRQGSACNQHLSKCQGGSIGHLLFLGKDY
jgi:hypothetical protein